MDVNAVDARTKLVGACFLAEVDRGRHSPRKRTVTGTSDSHALLFRSRFQEAAGFVVKQYGLHTLSLSSCQAFIPPHHYYHSSLIPPWLSKSNMSAQGEKF